MWEWSSHTVFCAYPGFTRLRLHTRNDSTVAFVEFQDVRQATLVMNALQGCRISRSHRGGVRIEYARNRMGDITSQCFSFCKGTQKNVTHRNDSIISGCTEISQQ
ncbi:unnamed protein product [Litomosoides sigmodontis]|uniref:RRM domain-containing protein n=1 Tax=Litomosoides sigmodontis TaxID=42156 RepID=A0A3P6UFI2_LITSI|nr:unnamed protein product [Litomosoides sigmodontis]